MDKRTLELENANRALLEAQIRFQTVHVQRLQIERDIALLRSITRNLMENIRFLKKKNIIVAASEYKKIKNDLDTAISRINFLINEKEYTYKIEKRSEDLYNKTKENHDRILNLIQNPPNNVIKVDFRRKNGK